MVFDLNKLLAQWKEAGLIDPHQAQRIQEYEDSHLHKRSFTDWSLIGFILLGSLTTGIGIIAIVAANWWKIPDFIKLTTAFILLGTLAVGAFKFWDRKDIRFESLLILLGITSLACIGLISQIYHTSGSVWELLLFWSVITSGLACFAQYNGFPFVWVFTLLIGLGLMASENIKIPFQPLFNQHLELVIFFIFLVCAICALLSRWLKAQSLNWAFNVWTFVSGVIALIFFELSPGVPALTSPVYRIGYMLTAILTLLVMTSNLFKKITKILILLILIGFLCFPFLLTVTNNSFLHALLTLIILVETALFLAIMNQRGPFYVFIFLLEIRFVILYFEAFGGLALTGLGLIISGLFIIGAAFLWQRYREILFTWSHKLSS